MHARSRDSCIISLIYVRVKVAHSWKLKAGFRACSLPQSSACWMWPPFWLDVWSPVVFVCTWDQDVFQLVNSWSDTWQRQRFCHLVSANLQCMRMQCRNLTHRTREEADQPVTVWALPKSFWLLTDPQQHPEDWKTKQNCDQTTILTISENYLLFTKALQLPYFFFYLLMFFSILNCVYMQWINFEIFWLLNELTLKRTNFWHSLSFSNKQDLSYCRIKVITVLPLTRQMICFVSLLQEMTC